MREVTNVDAARQAVSQIVKPQALEMLWIEITKTEPEKSLTHRKHSKQGRNNRGVVTVVTGAAAINASTGLSIFVAINGIFPLQ